MIRFEDVLPKVGRTEECCACGARQQGMVVVGLSEPVSGLLAFCSSCAEENLELVDPKSRMN